jgi:hypothetical protein
MIKIFDLLWFDKKIQQFFKLRERRKRFLFINKGDKVERKGRNDINGNRKWKRLLNFWSNGMTSDTL